MDPNTIIVWAQLGGQLVQVGTAAYDRLKQFLNSGEDVTADNAALDRVHDEYQRRIAQADREAQG